MSTRKSVLPTQQGVYLLRNDHNNRVYVGQSANCPQRWHAHVVSLKTGKHPIPLLQEDWNEYNPESFSFRMTEVISALDKALYRQRELYWIREYINELGCGGLYNSSEDIVLALKLPTRPYYSPSNAFQVNAAEILAGVAIQGVKLHFCKACQAGPFDFAALGRHSRDDCSARAAQVVPASD